MKISFADDAFETFQGFISNMDGYAAEVTTVGHAPGRPGTTLDVVLCGPDHDHEWGDAIKVKLVDNEWEPTGEEFTVRAAEVHIH